jgi:hypothetical protein
VTAAKGLVAQPSLSLRRKIRRLSTVQLSRAVYGLEQKGDLDTAAVAAFPNRLELAGGSKRTRQMAKPARCIAVVKLNFAFVVLLHSAAAAAVFVLPWYSFSCVSWRSMPTRRFRDKW